ncbi:MAG TPA: hypothetical protein VLA56_05810, partial [Pseudomonadales bacterium]|nr:hypothetical protein [Pseudomonadales bacterium]
MPPSRARRAVLLVALGAASGLLAACATLAGGAPAAPACDAELLVSHYDADRVARFDGCSGAWLGDLRHDGELAGPQALRLGPDGLLYVVSERNDRILRFDPRTHAFVDVWLESPRLAAPTAIDFGADGAAFIGSYGGDRVLRYAGGELTDFLIGGDVDGVDAGMAFGPDGHLWIPAFESGVLLVVDPATRAVLRRIRTGLVNPRMLLWAPDGSYLLIGSWGNDAILSLDLTDPAAEPQ